MKRQRSWNYHTKVLIPREIADKAKSEEKEIDQLEVILLWGEAHRSAHHFKRGDECCHIDNLDQVLHVDKIMRSYPKPENGEKQKPKIDGILVHWWQEENCQNCGLKI